MPRRRRRRRRRTASTGTAIRYRSDAVLTNRYRIDALAARQRGQVKWSQLRRRGMAKAALTRAIRNGRLHRIHPGVYSVIPPALMSLESRHAAAVLAGGPGAALCADSARWWVGLTQDVPQAIHVATRGAPRPVAGVRWHRLRLRDEERTTVRQMPVTVPARIPIDLAAESSVWELKGLLAELEYHCAVSAEDVAARLRPGMRGAGKLRRAIAEHTPALATTRSELERAFARFLVARGFALPDFNHPEGKATVDAIYARERLAIELDGVRGHSGERRVLRDHRRDLHRRRDGFTPLRYHYTQVTSAADQALIEAELDRLGVPRTRDVLGDSGTGPGALRSAVPRRGTGELSR